MPVIHCLVNEADRGEHFVLRRKTQGGGRQKRAIAPRSKKYLARKSEMGAARGVPAILLICLNNVRGCAVLRRR